MERITKNFQLSVWASIGSLVSPNCSSNALSTLCLSFTASIRGGSKGSCIELSTLCLSFVVLAAGETDQSGKYFQLSVWASKTLRKQKKRNLIYSFNSLFELPFLFPLLHEGHDKYFQLSVWASWSIHLLESGKLYLSTLCLSFPSSGWCSGMASQTHFQLSVWASGM